VLDLKRPIREADVEAGIDHVGLDRQRILYLIVTSKEITVVPEVFPSLPVAVTAKASVPRYRLPAVYWKVEMLSFFSLPRLGFCEISVLLIVPGNLIGNWQLSLGATVIDPFDFSPQFASVTDIEHSDAANARFAGAKHMTVTTVMVARRRLFIRSFPFGPG
jgi:hypothetical protein